MKVKMYNSNATIFTDDAPNGSISISFDGWDDFTEEENAEGLIEEVETAINRKLTKEENEELLLAFNFELSAKSGASKLKLERERRNLTQQELSDRTGINLRTIQAYEQGYKDINKAQVGKVKKIAEILRCDICDIID